MNGIAAIALAAAALGTRSRADAQNQLPASPSCGGPAERLPALSLLAVHTLSLARGELKCLALPLDELETARISVHADAGFLRARILEPTERRQVQ